MLEWINRFRKDPAGEYARYISSTTPLSSPISGVQEAITYFHVDLGQFQSELAALAPAAPLAWNDSLSESALAHTRVMIQKDGQQHQFPGEPDPWQRMAAAGYDNPHYLGENIAAYTSSVPYAQAGLIIDWGPGPGGMQTGRGHRENLISPDFNEVGIAILPSSSPNQNVGPLVVTQDFGSRYSITQPYLLGVVYEDTDRNQFYTAGEGLGGVTVQVLGAGRAFSTTTWDSGGYQLNVPPGTYNVTFSGGGLAAAVTRSVTIGTQNAKLDLLASDTAAQPTIQFSATTASVREGEDVLLTLTRSGDLSAESTVTVAIDPSSTAQTSDHDPLPDNGLVRFQANQSTATLRIHTVDDNVFEGSENLVLRLENPSQATLGAAASTRVTITDNDPPPTPTISFATGSLSISEGGIVTLTLIRTGSTAAKASVKVVVDKSSTAKTADYKALPSGGTVQFAAGQTTQAIKLTTVDDRLVETDEALILRLQSPSGASLGAVSLATITITDNEPPPPRLVSVETTLSQAGLTSLIIQFDGGLNPSTVTNASAYTLRAPGKDGRFGTKDDVKLTLNKPTFAAASKRVTLPLKTPYALSGPLQLVVNPKSIKNSNGTTLAGPNTITFSL